jgi:C-terminal processing protease CtpA/Prc
MEDPSISPSWGRKRSQKIGIMRKAPLILLGAAAGIAGTLAITQPRLLVEGSRAQAAAAGSYGQLSLFGEVFERVRVDYVEKPDPGKLIKSAISGMLAGLDPHSGYMDAKDPGTCDRTKHYKVSYASFIRREKRVLFGLPRR